MPEYVAIDHPRFRKVDAEIFVRQIVADCMTHRCRYLPEGPDHLRLDACCQYGADADLGERDKILARADEIKALLRDDAKTVAWFDDEVEPDPDAPSGGFVRTAVHGDGCVFLAHDRRGCAIHRASIANGWDFRGTKPHVCRLFPLSYTTDSIVISDDYPDYSCAYEPDAPSLYRVARDTLAEVFGADLVATLDALEASLGIEEQPRVRRLPIVMA